MVWTQTLLGARLADKDIRNQEEKMAAGKESAEGAGKSEGGKRTERNAGPGSRRSELEGNAETEKWH